MKFKADTKPNVQDLLKILAITTMIIDHFSLFIYFDSNLRLIGRIAAPIFLYFAGYNYAVTKKKRNLNICIDDDKFKNLFVTAFLVQVLLIIYIPAFSSLNILISIIIGLICVDIAETYKIKDAYIYFISIGLIYFTYEIYDYGTLSTTFILLGFRGHNKRGEIYSLYLGISLIAYLVFNSFLFGFGVVQIMAFAGFCILLFYALLISNFDKTISFDNFQNKTLSSIASKFLLLSRYSLEIYFLHISLLTIACGFLYF